jgi:hypothetical protein
MRNLKFAVSACGVVIFLSFAGSSAQAASFHVPTIPTFKVGSLRVPKMPSFSAPVRKVVVPPTIATAANFLASKKH